MTGSAKSAADRILEIGYAFWKSKALLSAVELGLFTELGSGSLECESLAKQLGLHQRSARTSAANSSISTRGSMKTGGF
jgi:hypothetical protein